jgi:putative MATE family efflux protein
MTSITAEHSAAPPKPLWKTFIVFLVPMMATNVLQALSGTVNSIFLGNMLGVHALSVVSSFFPLLFLLMSFIIGVASGATVLIGQAYGANELGRIKAVAGATLTVAIVLAVIFGAVGAVFTRQMLLLTHTPPDIIGDTEEYARIFLISMPLLYIFIVYTTITRGVGDVWTPFFALLLSNGVGLILTPALIRGWFGLPQLGVMSGAYAASASFLITIVGMGSYLVLKRHPLAPDRMLLRSMVKLDWRLLKLLVRVGVPTGVQVMLFALSEYAVISFVNPFGSGATAAYGAVMQIVSYVQMPAISIGVTASVFGSQAIGRRDAGQLGKITRTGIELQFVITGALVLIVYAFSRSILRLFITSPEVVDVAEDLVRITLWSYLVYGLVSVVSGIMRSSGAVFWPTTLSITAIWGVQVPMSYLLSRAIGLEGVWIAYPIAFIAMFLMQSGYYRLVWRKKTHERLI